MYTTKFAVDFANEIESEMMSARSTWSKAVVMDAQDLFTDNYAAAANYNGRDAETPAEFVSWLLNGASDWSQYSWGGSALCYDCDIAAHYCTPSELKKTRNGERRPNSREDWLDVQARALGQAARMLDRIYRRVSGWNASK